MKLQGRVKFASGELGRLFWVTGTADKPAIGNIYTQEKEATDFTIAEVKSIVMQFGHGVDFLFGGE